MPNQYSYEQLQKAFDDNFDDDKSIFEHIIEQCKLSSSWWETLHLWWDRMDHDCKKRFFRYLFENDETKFVIDLIENKIDF